MSEAARRGLVTSACLIVLAWLALTASTWGIVVWQSEPFFAQGHSRPAIRCTYFNGTSLFQRGYLYSKSGGLGYSRCPLWARAPL